jgi:hypothetical protein
MHHVTSSPLQVPINGTGLPTNQECHLPTNGFSYENFQEMWQYQVLEEN